MNNERIEEINDFVNRFNKDLDLSHKRWEEQLKKDKEDEKKKANLNKTKSEKKKKVFVSILIL